MKKTCKDCVQVKDLSSFKLGGSGKPIGVCNTCLQRRERKANPERFRRKKALRRQKYPELAILRDSRNSDRKYCRPGNDLDREYIRQAISGACIYCGDSELRMTLDRIDNKLAHTKANCVPACLRCNYMRGSMPFEAWQCLIPGVKEAREKGLFGAWHARPFAKRHAGRSEDATYSKDEVSAIAKATHPPRVSWPSTEELAEEVAKTSLRKVALRLGCSHVMVGKRLGRYQK